MQTNIKRVHVPGISFREPEEASDVVAHDKAHEMAAAVKAYQPNDTNGRPMETQRT